MHSKILGFLIVTIAASALAPAQWSFDYTAQPNAVIPPSGTGGQAGLCSNPSNVTTVTMNGSDAVFVSKLTVNMTFSHSWARDLRISLSHAGTAVVLFDQLPAVWGHGFSGNYEFDDDASSTIAAGVTGNFNVLGGTYQPASALSAFDGHSSSGPWVLTFCDLQGQDTGFVVACGVSAFAGSYYDRPFQFAEPIAEGGQWGCVTPSTYVINVPAGGGPVTLMQLTLGLIHARAADLTVTVTHGNVTATIMATNTPASTGALGDIYYFADDAPQSWDTAVGNAGIFAVPGGIYRPDTPLAAFNGVDSAGPWFVTLCDGVLNSATGAAFDLAMSLQTSGYRLVLSQPSGSSSIVLSNTGGVPGDYYLNAFTLVPGSFPAGWLNGLDIALADVVTQINWGSPFFGTLDSSGNSIVTVPGPIPASLPVWFTSFDITPQGVPFRTVPARNYLTAP
jgi:subtilisin-like proprotein convertase family protein